MQSTDSQLTITFRAIVAVMASPSLRRLQLAYLGFNAVESGTWVAILLYAYHATGPASVGLVALAQLLPAGLFAPLAATLGDHHPRERALLGGYVLLALMLAATAAAMLLEWPPLAAYAPAVCASTVLTLIRPAQYALLPSLATTPEQLTAANAVSSMVQAGGLLLGPLAAAAILAVYPPGWVIIALAGATVAAALLVAPLAQLRRRPAADADADTGRIRIRWHHAAEGFRILGADADARLIIAVLSSRSLMIGAADVLFVLLALEFFGTGESGAAGLTAALGAGGLIGGAAAFLLVGYPRIAPVLVASAAACGITFAAILVPETATLAPVLVVVAGIGLAVMEVAGRTVLQRAVPNRLLARVFGVLEGLDMWALGAGSILASAVAALFGLQASVLVFAAVLPLSIAAAWPALRALDRRTLVPQRELALLRHLRLFEALPPAAMEGLAKSATTQRVPAGAAILREGEPGDRFYVLESGAVSAWKQGRQLRRLTARGDSFGEIALLHDIPRTATIVADQPTVLLVIARADFLGAVTGNASAALEAARVAEARLADEEA